MNAIVPSQDMSALVERVLVNGDLSKLTPAERMSYYRQVCESTGLNPLTKPFDYLTLNGKMVLYALRGATDQLRAIHKVSVVESTETEREGVLIVTTKVQNADGRTDIARGAVNIAGLKGEVLANAILKAETKAKRRATLSICGLGLLDETEVETIPGARPATEAQDGHSAPVAITAQLAPEPPPAPKMTPQEWTDKALERIAAISTFDGLTDFETRFATQLFGLKENHPALHKQIEDAMKIKTFDLG